MKFTPDDLPRRLSPGRQAVSREEIGRIQRERILAAVADVAGSGGYAAVSVESITATAGMSRRTFYEYFKNKDEAFFAAYDRAAGAMEQVVAQAYDEAGPTPTERAIASMRALTGIMTVEPVLTQMCVVEVLAAGPVALERRDRSMRAMADLIANAAADIHLEHPPPDTTARTIVGGIYEVIHSRIISGTLPDLPGLVPDFVYAVILPYLGSAAAREAFAAAREQVNAAASE